MGPKRSGGPVEGTVVVVDVGHSMITGDHPPIDSAKQALLGYLQSNILFKPSALFGLVLYGTQQMSNELEYPNVWELYPLQNPSIKALQGVGEVDVGADQADFLSGLIVALDRLAKANGSGENRVILITDGQSPVADVEQISDIAESMKEMGVKLDVLGINFDSSSPSTTHREVLEVFDNMKALLGDLYRYLPIATAIEILMQTRKPPVSQRFFFSFSLSQIFSHVFLSPRATFSNDLEITSKLNLPIKMYSLVREEKFPRLTRESTLAENSPVKRELCYTLLSDTDVQVSLSLSLSLLFFFSSHPKLFRSTKIN